MAWSPGEVTAYLRARLHALVAAERAREVTRATWRAAAEELPFPFEAPRPVQDEAMAAVAEALESGRHLLLAAPTGVGKTAAALYPAVKLALATGRRVAMLTAKTLQQALAVQTLQAMQRGGWSSIQIRAKAKMCANREVVCHEEFCLHARDYGSKLAERGVLPALLSAGPHLDPDRIYAVAHAAEVCPFEVSLELLRETSAVVCDYNYVFDPTIALFGLAEEGSLENTFLIVDEAHNLVDRAREYYSPRLSRATVRDARRLVEGHRHRVCRELHTLLGELDQFIASRVSEALGSREGSHRAALEPEPLSEFRIAPRRARCPLLHVQARRRAVARARPRAGRRCSPWPASPTCWRTEGASWCPSAERTSGGGRGRGAADLLPGRLALHGCGAGALRRLRRDVGDPGAVRVLQGPPRV